MDAKELDDKARMLLTLVAYLKGHLKIVLYREGYNERVLVVKIFLDDEEISSSNVDL